MKKAYITALLVLHFSALTHGQALFGAVEYLRVENRDAFKSVQEKWNKIHTARAGLKEISGWSLYEVSSRIMADPYNYVRVTYYDSFLKMDKGISERAVKKAYPDISDTAWQAMIVEEKNSCKIVSSGVFYRELACLQGLDKNAAYFMISEIAVTPGKSKDFLSIEDEIYKPVFEKLIEDHECTAWSIWSKWTGETENYHFIVAQGFMSLEKIDEENFGNAFTKVHPGKDYGATEQSLASLRTMKNSEIWKVIFRTIQ